MSGLKKATSKERLLNAIAHIKTDYVPLYFLMMYSSGNIPFSWENQVERVEKVLNLGLDDTLWLQPPLGYVEAYNADMVPGVKSITNIAPAGMDEIYPVITKTYNTPEGPLTQVVRKTEDWPYGDDIYLFSDFNVSRSKEYAIKNYSDIARLRFLLNAPDKGQMDRFREEAKYLRREAGRLGVALEGGWSALGDAVVWLCGMESTLAAQMEEPEFVEDILDVICDWEIKRNEMLMDEGVDIIVHMAWYEGLDFWTPGNYRRMLKPRLKRIIDRVHERGLKFRYIITKGWKPLMDDFVEMGIDCISGVDPVQDKIVLPEVKERIGNKICLMGGINSSVMLTQWEDEKIEYAVRDAIEIMSPGGGFILYPVDQIFTDTPWSKVRVLIEAWKKYR